jgi:hypothetical protein
MAVILVAGLAGCVVLDDTRADDGPATPPSVAGVLALADADVRYVGPEDAENFGWAVAGAGDADGDGLDDIVFSSPWGKTAWLARGPVAGTLADADTVWSGLYAGYHLDGGDDYDGDGLDDIVMGLRLDGPIINRFVPPDYAHIPVVRVFRGESDGVLAAFDTPSASFVHAENADLWTEGGTREYEVAWVDGVLAVGEPTAGPGNDRGVVWLLTDLPVLGELDADADARLVGAVDFMFVGRDVRAAGDTDGDGTAEVIASMGEPLDRRAVLVPVDVRGDVVMDGSQTTVIPGAAHEPTTVQDGGVDVTADGLDDVLVTMTDADAAGEVWSAVLLDGPIAGARDVTDNLAVFRGTSAEALWIETARFAGDVDGDGFEDVLVGAEGSLVSDPGGVAALFLGPLGGTRELLDGDILFPGEASGADTGHAIDAAGDVDGDGLADLLIGAPDFAPAEDSRGAVYVVRGATLFP